MSSTEPATSALTLRITCGLLASAARFVPVPFLDDVLRAKAIHLLVARTLKQHERSYPSDHVAPLWGDPSGCLSGCLVGALNMFVKLVTWPLRKLVSWLLAAKYLAYDLSETALLGHTLDRMLASGAFAEESDEATRRVDAIRLRKAFDNALAGTDMKLLRSVLAAAVRSVRGLPRAALAALRRLRDPETSSPTEGLPEAQKSRVEEGSAKVEAALSTPEMRAFFEAFDTRLDENLEILLAREDAAP